MKKSTTEKNSPSGTRSRQLKSYNNTRSIEEKEDKSSSRSTNIEIMSIPVKQLPVPYFTPKAANRLQLSTVESMMDDSATIEEITDVP